MSPEQLRAFHDGRGVLDGRSDVFSLGVILFELLTARHPFPVRRGPTATVLPEAIADRTKPPPSARGQNPSVSPGCGSRFRTTTTFAAALAAYDIEPAKSQGVKVVRADHIAQALTERNETGDEDSDEEPGT